MRKWFWAGVCLLGYSTLVFGAKVDELSTDWIVKSIRDHHVTDIEQLLGTFQPESLKLHLLVYGSESQQASTFLSPRVIVYNYDADFIMAFNGDPSLAGYHDLEILRFDHRAKKFRAEVIHFDPKGKAEPKLDAHPTECASCHQKDIRPNWEPYFHWVGFYGSEDDNENAREWNPGGVLRRGPEFDQFPLFLAKQRRQIAEKQGRYRFLPPHPASRPNLHFNDRVTCLNIKRFVRAFLAHPEAARIWPAVHAAQVAVDELPEDLRQRAKHSYQEIKADTERVIRKAIRRRIARHARLTGSEPLGRVKGLERDVLDSSDVSYDIDMVAGWRYVFEEIFHEPFRPFSTSGHEDYQLNLGASLDFDLLTGGAEVDDKTGRLIIPAGAEYRFDVSENSYEYACHKADRYFDLPPGSGRVEVGDEEELERKENRDPSPLTAVPLYR